ncbi:MAG: hypothetical protein VBE63_08370 [Lamprobacter sp.]|uniref:hypothetical protein n=1 Tax=Lamprobacter sp. TaxID=3100796 RepID=UPI002B25953F|nr:hypothetical protein [Lamprobacter sp.]MEA3639944.1 hypothetical protein [Lamprobacter sp.]
MTLEAKKVRQALKFLLQQDNYNELKQEIFTLAKTPHGGFQDDYFVLDPLVTLVREKPVDVVDDVFGLCDRYYRRRHPEDRKTAYQRQYMAERRRRLNTAIKIKQRLDRRLMSAEEKDEFRSETQAWWMVVQEEWLVERGGTRSPELVQQFWDEIDAQLEDALNGDEQAARKVLGV